jgi:hypothetical protein
MRRQPLEAGHAEVDETVVILRGVLTGAGVTSRVAATLLGRAGRRPHPSDLGSVLPLLLGFRQDTPPD